MEGGIEAAFREDLEDASVDHEATPHGPAPEMKDEHMKEAGAAPGLSASDLISRRIAELGDWRGDTLSRMRKLIKEADPDVVEEWKWMGTPVWSHDGIICTGESYKSIVKLTFAKGASLKDPDRLFNSSLDGKVRRAIDIHEGEKVDARAFKGVRFELRGDGDYAVKINTLNGTWIGNVSGTPQWRQIEVPFQLLQRQMPRSSAVRAQLLIPSSNTASTATPASISCSRRGIPSFS